MKLFMKMVLRLESVPVMKLPKQNLSLAIRLISLEKLVVLAKSFVRFVYFNILFRIQIMLTPFNLSFPTIKWVDEMVIKRLCTVIDVDIYIAAVSPAHNVCAKNHYLAIVSTIVETDNPHIEIKAGVDLLGPILDKYIPKERQLI